MNGNFDYTYIDNNFDRIPNDENEPNIYFFILS